MSRKQLKRRSGSMAVNAIAGLFIFAIVCGVGFGVASADPADDLALDGAFGFDDVTTAATATTERIDDLAAPQEAIDAEKAASELAFNEQSVLASTSQRSIEAGLKMIDDREEAERKRAEEEAAAERARIEAENAAIFDRVAAQKEMQGIVGAIQEEVSAQAEEIVYEYDLPAIDWSVGQEAFLDEWTARIDAYLEGSPLAGYGRVFAEAAWENGVDPRWSPAISCTESSKGSVCFMPFNAWGWGNSGWSDWESAIRAHVAGLAQGYGYCITPDAAVKYCPPNSAYWYANTISQMAEI